MDIIILSALTIEVVVLSGLEIRGTGTRITPFGLLAFPYLAVVLIAFVLGPSLDFLPLNTNSLIIWMRGLFLVWLTGYFLARIVPGADVFRCLSQRFKAQFHGEASAEKLSAWFAIALIPFLILNVLLSLRAAGGWSGLASPEFKSAYAQGWLAHAIAFTEPLFILLVGTAKRKNKFRIAIAVILMMFLLLGQVKGRVLQPLLGGFLYRVIRGRSSISVKSAGIVVLCGVLAFVSIYLGGMSIADPSLASNPDTYVFLGRHLFYYLTAGVLGFSEASGTGTRDFGGSSTDIFAPFVNVYRTLTGSGKLVAPGNRYETRMQVDLTTESVDAYTNVYTIFGTLYFYLGPWGSFIYVAVMGFLCYALFLARDGQGTSGFSFCIVM